MVFNASAECEGAAERSETTSQTYFARDVIEGCSYTKLGEIFPIETEGTSRRTCKMEFRIQVACKLGL